MCEKAALKSHGPQMDKRPKTTYEIWVVLNIVMLREQSELRKDLLKHLAVILYLSLQILDRFIIKCWGQHQLHDLFQIHQYSPSTISLRKCITNQWEYNSTGTMPSKRSCRTSGGKPVVI